MTQFSNNTIQKLYRFEVDQSVRIEELNRNSVIGIANKENSYTLLVSKRVKMKLLEHYRRLGQPKLFSPMVFAAAIIIALNKLKINTHDLIIDIEYPGYEQSIIKVINQLFPEMTIYFTTIGRKSTAHYAAYGVHIKKRKHDTTASAKEILQVLKNGPRTVTPPDKAERFAAHPGPSNHHYSNH